MLLIILLLIAFICLLSSRREEFIVADAQDIQNYSCITENTYRHVSPFFNNKGPYVTTRDPPYVFNPIGHNYDTYLNAASPYDGDTRILSTSTKGLPGTEASNRLNVPLPVPANYAFPIV